MSTEAIILAVRRAIACAAISIFLVACDGGIFGTGDGEIIDPSESANTDLSPADTEEDGVGDGAASTPVTDEQANAVDQFDPAIDVLVSSSGEFVASNRFTNNNGGAALVSFVNLTDMRVEIFESEEQNIDSILSTSALSPTAASSDISATIPSGTPTLFIDSVQQENERRNLARVDVSNLNPGTNTLFVLRNTEPSTNIIALPIISVAVQNQLDSSIRIVSAGLIGDPLVPSTFTLTPTMEAGNDAPQVSYPFSAVSASEPVTQYETVPQGVYILSDDVGRYTNITININNPMEGQIYTLILHPELPEQYILLNDTPQ